MRKQRASQKNHATGLTPSNPWRLAQATPLENYRLEVEFTDGTQGFVDMSTCILGENAGVFASLRDQDIFNQVQLIHGVATWPGEIDLAPDAMYDEIQQHGTWTLT
mgnify:CR=1 FL=1|jgi:hypothetical protein